MKYNSYLNIGINSLILLFILFMFSRSFAGIPVPDFYGTPRVGNLPLPVQFYDVSTTASWTYPNILSHGDFINAAETTYYAFEFASGSTGLPIIVWYAFATDSAGQLENGLFSFTYYASNQGVKMTLLPFAWIPYQSGQWYIARMKVFSPNPGNDFQYQLNNFNGSPIIDYSTSALYYSVPTVWTYFYTPLYTTATGLGYPQVIFKNYTSVGLIYIDEIQVVNASPADVDLPTNWQWLFGDFGTSNAQNPSHTYNNSGIYSVELIASNSYGSSTMTKLNYITASILPPIINGNVAYSDSNHNTSVDLGDKLTLQFDRRMQVNSASVSDFFLPITGDSLGSGATVSINSVNDTQVVITLGALPMLTISGAFSGITSPGSPSGIDISSSITPNAIEDLDGIDAQPSGIKDILFTLQPSSTYVSAFSSATVEVDTTNAYYTEHKLIIPKDSLATSTTIFVGPPGNNHGELSAVSFSPADLTFSSSIPATLVIEYKDADARSEAGYMENALRIHQWKDDSTGWVLVPQTFSQQSIDLVNKTVSIKIDKLNMVGATGGFFKSFLAENTTIVYANIDLPTVEATSTIVASAPSGFWYNKFFSPETTMTISVGTAGIYTNHKLTLTNYTTAYSGVTVILAQATLAEKGVHPNYAILKIVTYGQITTQTILTMEYKDHDDANNQFKNDVISGVENQMRIYRWRQDLGNWEKIPGTQIVNISENTVTATIDSLSLSQIYAVKVDPTVSPVAVDYLWEKYYFSNE